MATELAPAAVQQLYLLQTKVTSLANLTPSCQRFKISETRRRRSSSFVNGEWEEVRYANNRDARGGGNRACARGSAAALPPANTEERILDQFYAFLPALQTFQLEVEASSSACTYTPAERKRVTNKYQNLECLRIRIRSLFEISHL